jgi:hypothetical protein
MAEAAMTGISWATLVAVISAVTLYFVIFAQIARIEPRNWPQALAVVVIVYLFWPAVVASVISLLAVAGLVCRWWRQRRTRS